jgi:hypothetical protein
MATYMLGNPNALFGSPMMPRPVAAPMMPAPAARPAAPTSAANLQTLLALSGQDRANAFLKGLGAMGPALIAAGAPSTDPGAAQKNIALAGQLRAKTTQDDLARQRAANVQALSTQIALQKAGREQQAFDRAEQQRQRLMTLAETAASQAEAAGNQTLADMIRANPTAFIESEYAKQLETIKGKPKDRYLSIPQLGVADLVSGIVYTPQGPFRMGPQPTTAVAPGTTAQVPPAVPSAALPQVPAPDASALSPQARERVAEADIKRSKEPTDAEKKVDEIFAKDYNENIGQGGIADASKQITQLAEVKQRLETQQGLTGPLIGLIPEFARPYVVPEAAAAQDAVEEVVQRNLRLILGAQFTAEEGKRLIARAYNPALDQKENAKRLGRLLESMQNALTQKLNAYKYYEENRTLRGYQGASKFSVDDIIKAAELDAAPKRAPSINIRRK